ncbi:hypothetical protein NKJ06_18875 [Mesorhizobium sp. M0293]|uniref:hypothetical protein n=1 Tax=Mesorhizobium sp. M0293 TaxID=2956930 RepID=UPI003339AA61
MKDWLHDDDRQIASMLGVSVRKWRDARRCFVEHDLLRVEDHPVEGPILRFVHPEHLAAVGLMLGSRR